MLVFPQQLRTFTEVSSVFLFELRAVLSLCSNHISFDKIALFLASWLNMIISFPCSESSLLLRDKNATTALLEQTEHGHTTDQKETLSFLLLSREKSPNLRLPGQWHHRDREWYFPNTLFLLKCKPQLKGSTFKSISTVTSVWAHFTFFCRALWKFLLHRGFCFVPTLVTVIQTGLRVENELSQSPPLCQCTFAILHFIHLHPFPLWVALKSSFVFRAAHLV